MATSIQLRYCENQWCDDPTIVNAQGRLTSYAFGCGYTERIDNGTIHTQIWREHNVYHIRSTDYSNGGNFRQWDTARTLTGARKVFARHIRMYHRKVKGVHMTYITISHNPFARTEVQRRVTRTHNCCDNCGQSAKISSGNNLTRLYQYRVVPDDGPYPSRNGYSLAAFCNIDCWRQYSNTYP